MRKIILILIVIGSGFAAKAQRAGYAPITDIAKFNEQFATVAKKTETIKSDFVQEKDLEMLSEKITSKGKFWFKKDNLLRMEYTSPFQYLMILNKDNVYVKDGQKENKISTKSSKVFQQINRITIDCVQGSIINNPDFKTKIFESKGTYMVEMSPVSKALKDFFSTIDVIIDKKDYSVTTIEMHEVSGDSTVIHFTNKELNTAIPDAFFAIK